MKLPQIVLPAEWQAGMKYASKEKEANEPGTRWRPGT
jgi:hypothetical protein